VVGAQGVGVAHFVQEHFQLEGKREVVLNNQDFKWR
jgi:hypothetical protein